MPILTPIRGTSYALIVPLTVTDGEVTAIGTAIEMPELGEGNKITLPAATASEERPKVEIPTSDGRKLQAEYDEVAIDLITKTQVAASGKTYTEIIIDDIESTLARIQLVQALGDALVVMGWGKTYNGAGKLVTEGFIAILAKRTGSLEYAPKGADRIATPYTFRSNQIAVHADGVTALTGYAPPALTPTNGTAAQPGAITVQNVTDMSEGKFAILPLLP